MVGKICTLTLIKCKKRTLIPVAAKNAITLNKKETSNLFQSEDLTQSKTRFLKMKRATRLSPMAVHDMKPVS